MTGPSVVLTGTALTLDEVVAVARDRRAVALDPEVVDRMARSRAVLERSLARMEPVYGLTTGVAALKRVTVGPESVERFNRVLVQEHRIAQGPLATDDQVRAIMLRLANHLASGLPGVRPALVEHLVGALNRQVHPPVRTLGSVGISDLGQNADLAAGIFEGVALAAGEALALLNHNAFSTGIAALGVADAIRFLEAAEAIGALSLEAFAANLNLLHESVAATRPYPGIRISLQRLRVFLQGSYLWRPEAARNLQDPLTFRGLPQVLGAARDALRFAADQLAVELNASQGNPIVVPEEDRAISVANFEILPLAAALDFLRIALAPLLTTSAERSIKLLDPPWSGLASGLAEGAGAEPGLGELGLAAAAMAAEARLLAHPVSLEVASTSIAEGIEDRTTMAPLAARRLVEMVGLGERVLAIEWVVAAQAAELRGGSPLGRGTGRLHRLLRERIPAFRSAADFPVDLDPVRDLVRSGAGAA